MRYAARTGGTSVRRAVRRSDRWYERPPCGTALGPVVRASAVRYGAHSAPRRGRMGGTRLVPRTRGSFRAAEGRHRRYEARSAHAGLVPRRGGSASAVRGSLRAAEGRHRRYEARSAHPRLVPRRGGSASAVRGSSRARDARSAPRRVGIGGTRLVPRTRGSLRAAEGPHRRYEARIGGHEGRTACRRLVLPVRRSYRRYDARTTLLPFVPGSGGFCGNLQARISPRKARADLHTPEPRATGRAPDVDAPRACRGPARTEEALTLPTQGR